MTPAVRQVWETLYRLGGDGDIRDAKQKADPRNETTQRELLNLLGTKDIIG